MPLGGQKTLELKTADYQIGQARLNYEKLAKAVEQEVTDAWLAGQTFREKLKALRSEVAAAEQNYKDLQNQYEAGTATSLDTLVALRDLDAARTELVVQTYDYQVALRNLQRAMGVFQEERVRKVKLP